MFFETLESRSLFSVSLSAGVLTITGTSLNDAITVNKNAGGQVSVSDDGVVHNYAWASINEILVNGLGGNDSIIGQNGMTKPMLIHGNDGNDTLQGGGGNDSIYGDSGDDVLDGRNGANVLFGGAGLDTADYSNRTANLTISLDDVANDGAAGQKDNVHSDIENVNGGSGNDSIVGSSASNTLQGGAGNDSIDGGYNNDYIFGGAGNDSLTGGYGNDTIDGGNGNDTIYGNGSPTPAVYLVLPGAPNPYIDNNTIYGGMGNDSIQGGHGNDMIFAGDGDDSVLGSGGQSTIYGGAGNDQLYGGAGANWIYGDAGNDMLFGAGTQNVIYGGDGNDLEWGSSNAANNWLFGDNGHDVLYGSASGAGTSFLNGGADNDTIYGANLGINIIHGDAGNDLIYGGALGTNWIYGDAGDDILHAQGRVTNYVYGGDGNDQLFGGPGNDLLSGDAGFDTLVSVGGGQGDTVYGGTGVDSFWVDAEASEQTPDVDLWEELNGSVHRVDGFLNGVSRDLNGQNLVDPNAINYTYINLPTFPYIPILVNAYVPGSVNFSDKPLFPSTGPGENDIVQGQVGDCYLMAGLSGTAKVDPFRIRQSVVDLGDGTYGVQFYKNGVPTFVRVDADLPVFQGTTTLYYAGQGQEGSIWVPIMEKAFAEFRSAGTYQSINGGGETEPFTDLGSTSSTSVFDATSASNSLIDINNALADGEVVSAWTPGTGSTNGCPCVANHVYTVDHVNFQRVYAGSLGIISIPVSITLRNPWGFDGGGNVDSNVNDGYVTVSAAQFEGYFKGADAAFV